MCECANEWTAGIRSYSTAGAGCGLCEAAVLTFSARPCRPEGRMTREDGRTTGGGQSGTPKA